MNKKAHVNKEWCCPLCEAVNITNVNKCNVCLSWRCLSCYHYNPIVVGKCETCHKPKQSVGAIKNKKKKRKHKRNKHPSNNNVNAPIKDKLPHIESNIKLPHSNHKSKPKQPYPINIPNYNKSPIKSVLKTNARVYQSKNKQKTYSNVSKKPVRVALRNQNKLKTSDNLSHQYMNNYKSHSVSSRSMSPHSNYQSNAFPSRNNNNYNKSVSPSRSQYPSPSMQQQRNRNIRQSPRQEQKHNYNNNSNSSHREYKCNDYNGNNNRNMNMGLNRNDENVQKLIMFGYKMEHIERAWDMMKQNNKHKSVECDHGGLFIEIMLDYLKRIPANDMNNSMASMNNSMGSVNNRQDRKKRVKKQRSIYGIGEELYFKCKRVVVIAVDEGAYDVYYMIRYLDNGQEERAKEMYLTRRSDYYEHIGISQERNNVFMNGKYAYDNDQNERFYGPSRHRF